MHKNYKVMNRSC